MTTTRQALEELVRFRRRAGAPLSATELGIIEMCESALASAPEPDGELEHLREAAELLRNVHEVEFNGVRHYRAFKRWFKRDAARTPATGKDSGFGPRNAEEARVYAEESAAVDDEVAAHNAVPAEPPGEDEPASPALDAAIGRYRKALGLEGDEPLLVGIRRICDERDALQRRLLASRDEALELRRHIADVCDLSRPTGGAATPEQMGQHLRTEFNECSERIAELEAEVKRLEGIARNLATDESALRAAPPSQPTEPAKEQEPEAFRLARQGLDDLSKVTGAVPAQPAPLPGGKGPVDALRAELVVALRQVEEANPKRWFDALADRLEGR